MIQSDSKIYIASLENKVFKKEITMNKVGHMY